MEFEVIYHVSGILIAVFLLFIIAVLRKEKPELIKSRIFLRYTQFRTAFYVAAAGALFFVVGNVIGLLYHATLSWVHEITEIIYNLFLVVFVIVLYLIMRPKELGQMRGTKGGAYG